VEDHDHVNMRLATYLETKVTRDSGMLVFPYFRFAVVKQDLADMSGRNTLPSSLLWVLDKRLLFRDIPYFQRSGRTRSELGSLGRDIF
jgi:hypothetical protein